ncbi:MAG: hypothetical protein IJS68_02280 [Clostridia bacterium]|nr:hypothetical protein [Clostridia bacterium]
MQETKDNLTREIVITVLKTLAVIVFGGIFVIISFSLLFPQNMTGFYANLNMKKAEAYMYKRVYNHSGSNEDLYNLIESGINAENYSETVKYIKVMQKRAGFDDFCDIINERNIKNAENRQYVYVCDYSAYLNHQYTIALYLKGDKDKAEEFAIDALSNNANIYAWEFGAYVDCVMSDKTLSETVKKSQLKDLLIKEINTLAVEDLINNNLIMLDDPNTLEGYEKLRCLHQMIIIKRTYYILAVASDFDQASLDGMVSDITNLQDMYASTLMSL